MATYTNADRQAEARISSARRKLELTLNELDLCVKALDQSQPYSSLRQKAHSIYVGLEGFEDKIEDLENKIYYKKSSK